MPAARRLHSAARREGHGAEFSPTAPPSYAPSTDPTNLPTFDALEVFEEMAEIAIEAGAREDALTALLRRIESLKEAS
jgi:hypothetical protein